MKRQQMTEIRNRRLCLSKSPFDMQFAAQVSTFQASYSFEKMLVRKDANKEVRKGYCKATFVRMQIFASYAFTGLDIAVKIVDA